MQSHENEETLGDILKSQITVLGLFIAAFWATEIVDWFMNGALDRYGVVPRTVSGLYGILYAPFLHGDFPHLISNTVPFAVLGWFVLLQGFWRFFGVYLITSVVSGLGTWLIGDSRSVHIGASGVIFGFLGYLLLGAVFRRSIKSILFSLLAGVLYGGCIFGVLPGTPGVSWEGHLFGFLGGVLAAKLLANAKDE